MINLTPRKSTQNELTKAVILDAARDLFASEGYASLSMRKIANVLKCSHGAIYYHFKNKAELFYEIISTDFEKLDQELYDVMNDDQSEKDEKLFNVLYRYIKFGLTNQNHYEVMFLLRDDDVKSYLQEGPNKSLQLFGETVGSLVSKRLTSKDVYSLFLSLHGFVTHFCRTETTFEDIEDLARAHVLFLIKALQ
ncbi:TetR/AcrR family transcriptional regulator [Bacillus sp. CGMCC 1.16607]|uniref:TetR/AcrR family transcriptional regulator n=1 Tax=Bacillus sp. CGMCC 1.16607 TaxID=3351842 RepID=UPI0036349777